MANVLLTQRCVRSCPYCFAKEPMDNSTNDNLSWDNLLYLADFFESSGERHISLLGGEPTLHQHFTEFIVYLLERNFNVTVFTSGIMSQKKLDELNRTLAHRTPDRLSFVCNINEPERSPAPETAKQQEFLKMFGSLSSVSFNIYNLDFNISFIFDYIHRFGMSRRIRFGLAHPIPGEINNCIPAEGMKAMAQRFMTFAPLFEKFRVSPSFDCGMPLCVFTEEQIGRLFRLSQGTERFACGPAIDIGPDMTVWSCFPLHTLKKRSIYDFNSLEEVRRFYGELITKIRREEIGGIFEQCDDCRDLGTGACAGGCLAHVISGFRKEAPVRISEVYT
jgi:hypothetical protein